MWEWDEGECYGQNEGAAEGVVRPVSGKQGGYKIEGIEAGRMYLIQLYS